MNHLIQDRNNFVPNAFLSQTSNEPTSATQLSDAFEYFSDALILADAGARVTYLNPAAEQLLGLSLRETRGQVLDQVLTLQDGTTKQPLQINDFSRQPTPFSGAFHLLVRNGGGAIPVQCNVALTRTSSGAAGGCTILLRNASSLQVYINKLVTQSMHDEHSRLLRRAELVKRLWRLLQEADDGEPQAFMYLDLDNFKSVNDTAGHAAGDVAIREIASRLKDLVRGRDTLARLGGDEFGLLLERCPAERARQRAEQLHRVVDAYVLHWNGETFRLGVSIGLAIFKTHKHSLNAILAAADSACYRAKRSGGDGPRIQEIVLD